MMQPIISVKNLQKYFPIKKQSIFQRTQEYVKANKDITLDIIAGETLGIVGESGCGKSTFGRTVIQLQRQTGGATLYYGDTIDNFMPKYVKDIYTNLPKTSDAYDHDQVEIEAMEAQLEHLEGNEKETLFEALRLKRINFDITYGNTLRLVGGLVAHPNLKLVSKALQKRYDVASDVAQIKRELNFEKHRIALNPKLDDSKIASLENDLKKLEVDLDVILQEIKQLKEPIRNDEKFIKYEAYRDYGIDLASLTQKESRLLRKDLQIIFQDPYSSLDPRLSVGEIIGEGLLIHKLFKSEKDPGYQEYIIDIMEKCGLSADFIHRYPHQFSGGQRQRIGIARALALQPKFIVCDEAVSALDVSIQSQIINLLQELKEKHNLTYLFITHDLGVVRYISDRIGVMYFGNLVELAPADKIFTDPQHPYTKKLLNAIPVMDEDDQEIWDVDYEPETFDFYFHFQGEDDPDWVEVSEGHFVKVRLKDREAIMKKGMSVI